MVCENAKQQGFAYSNTDVWTAVTPSTVKPFWTLEHFGKKEIFYCYMVNKELLENMVA